MKFATLSLSPLALSALCLGIVLWGTQFAPAQQNRLSATFQLSMSRFIEPPRALKQALREAEEAIETQQYSEAVVTLGDLLERDIEAASDPGLAGQDFFLDIKESLPQRLDQSFLRRCRDLIGSLPVQGRNTYELRYGALARKLLEEASASRDYRKLREVRRKYFHTEAGYSASLILAQHELYTGHPLSASLLLDDVVIQPMAVDQLGNGAVALHAVACRRAGRPIPLTARSLDGAVAVGTDQPAPVEDWRMWIDEHYQFPEQDTISRSKEYPVLGGNPARNDTAQGQLALSSPRWMVETTATPREEQRIRRKGDDLAASGRLVPPSWAPIRVGDQLLMRTTERLVGVDHRTGKRVWQYPWFRAGDSLEADQGLMTLGRSTTDPTSLLAQRVWNDVPYGQITSDGERVFLLEDLSPAQYIQVNPLMGFRGSRAIQGGNNTLVALELATEGKTLWRLGKDPTAGSELNEAFFLGAPLPVDGRLYALVEMAGDISLVCLDPATGSLQWQQQLVANEDWGVQYNGIRRVSGATPSYHEGVLICPTGAGATVAVDLADRTLRWGNTYPRKAESGGMASRRQFSEATTEELLQRWHHGYAVVNGSVVLVTPVETDQLYCFNLIDGKRRFNKPRLGAFYAAGIRDDRFFVVGAHDVKCFDLEKGNIKWVTDRKLIVAGQQLIGRGVFGEDRYIVPTSGNELVSFSLETGELLERRTTSYPLGNLVAVDGEVISQSATQLAVAFGSETLGPRVEQMLEENPKDLDALIQKALLLTEQGARQEALEYLQRAREIDPESDDVLIMSITAMLGILRENESPPDELIAELDQLIDTPIQRMQFLALRLDGALRKGSVAEAVERLLAFSTVVSNETLLGNEDESILGDPARDCSLDSWIAARSEQLRSLAEENNELDAVNERIAEHLETRRLASSRLLERLVEHFRPFGVDDLIISLAERRLVEENQLAAERMLLGPKRPARLLEQGEVILSPPLATELVRVYGRGRLGRDALAVLRAVEAESGDNQDNPDWDDLEALAMGGISPSAETLAVEGNVQLTWRSQSLPTGIRATASAQYIDMVNQGGNNFAGWAVVNLDGAVMMQNTLGEQRRFATEMSRRNSDRRATVCGGIMILERPGQISAVDLFAIRQNRAADAMIWTRDFGADGSSVTQRRVGLMPLGDSVSYYPTNGLVTTSTSEFRVGPVLGDRMLVLQAGDLLCIRLTDGETIWRNSNAPSMGHLLVNDQTVAVVSTPDHQPSRIATFSLLDGRKLSEQAWNDGKAWTSCGNHLLTYEELQGGSVHVRLTDPFTGDVRLETTSAGTSAATGQGKGLGRVVNERYLVLMDAAGRLVVWDLLEGEQLCEHLVDAMPNLETMRAMLMGDQILVLPANTIKRMNASDMNTRHGEVHYSLHKMIAISTETGEINWKRDFENPWGCTVHQPYGSPVLLLARSKSIYAANRPRRVEMDVALIRLSDGETIHEEIEKSLGARHSGLNTTLTIRPLQNQVFAYVGGESLEFLFQDKPPAPIEPAEESEDESEPDPEDDA